MPLLLLCIAAVPVLVGLRVATMPVTPARMARFARLHRIAVTPRNEQHIVSYLSQTRSWRSVGVVSAYLVSLGWLLPQQRIALELRPLLAGWLIGAVLAERRFRHVIETGRDAAPADPVVPGWLFRVPPVLAAVAVAVTAAAFPLGRAAGRPGDIVMWGVAALAFAAVLPAVNRYVLGHPSVRAGNDDTGAERATAAHSIGAITAGGSALGLLCLTGQFDVVRGQFFDTTATAAQGIGLLWTGGALGIGYLVASAAWSGEGPDRPGGPRPLRRVLLVVAALAATSAGWAGYARHVPRHRDRQAAEPGGSRVVRH